MYVPAFSKLETSDKKELLRIIRSTKQKMGWLRKKMEHPDYNNIEKVVSPSDLVVYKCEREFLYLATAKYISLGGEYQESKKSLKDTAFNDRLEDIVKITFYNGGFFSANEKTIIDLSGDELKVMSGSFSEIYEKMTETRKEEFLYQLGELHIGEWRSHYSCKRFGMDVSDGIQWVLKFEYKDGKKKTFGGDNAFPYNFDELLEMLSL